MYYLTKFDNVIQSSFCVILKITSASLWKPNYDIINYSTSICPFESGKCGKEGKKLQEFEYLHNEKSFLDEMKNIFHSFWRAIIWWKNKKIDNKLVDTSLKEIIKSTEPCKCAILLVSRILWHKRINPSLYKNGDFDIWYWPATFYQDFFFSVFAVLFQWGLLTYLQKFVK